MAVGMYESFMTGHWFDADVKAVWSDVATLQAWLDVEAALAATQADVGLIPHEAARAIAQAARADRFDLERVAQQIAFAQHPLVPVLHRLEELCGEPAAGYLHWGATTQNIFDTASSLQMRRTHELIVGHLAGAIDALGETALRHQHTTLAGRTHGQHALPMTFGLKVAAWIDELDRDRLRLAQRVRSSFTANMGGAIGTHAAMGGLGRQVQAELARRLGLEDGGLASRASFDRAADYVAALGLLAGTAQKLAQDMVFMQRTEVDELSEAFHLGKVGSSTMAQKRNPSTALLLVSLSRMLRARVPLALEAMVRADEGDSSATNVADGLLPEVGILAVSVCATLCRLVRGLVVRPESMRRNVELTKGLIVAEAAMMRLSPSIGRHLAHRLLYGAAQRAQSEGVPLLTAIREEGAGMGVSVPEDLSAALEPTAYLGASAELTCEIVARARVQR